MRKTVFWGQPVHTSLPFSPFGVQREPYTNERAKRELCGWTDGRMDGQMDGDQKGPSIFLIFQYVNKSGELIPKMVSKVVYGFSIKSYEHFKFQNFDNQERFPSEKTAQNMYW